MFRFKLLDKDKINTGVVCTLGPTTDNKKCLKTLLKNNMKIARLNFSHGTHEGHQKRIKLLNSVADDLDKSVKIMADLEGFRIRLGKLKSKVQLTKGQLVILAKGHDERDDDIIPFDYQGNLKDIPDGAEIFIDDGKVDLRVIKSTDELLYTEVFVGTELSSRKGVNIPTIDNKIDSLTDKDREDIIFAAENGIKYIAQSFVRNAQDIEELRSFAKQHIPDCKIIAKVECESAIKNIDEIIKSSDMIMIARGDMGVVLPIFMVPFIQKEIIHKCRSLSVPVITATQMLESMVINSIPTRAEVADIANAVIDGTNYVMLSAETAQGNFPETAVKRMNEIIRYSESYIRASRTLILGRG